MFEELRALILKTFGLAEVLRAALDPVSSDIPAAFVNGSIARLPRAACRASTGPDPGREDPTGKPDRGDE